MGILIVLAVAGIVGAAIYLTRGKVEEPKPPPNLLQEAIDKGLLTDSVEAAMAEADARMTQAQLDAEIERLATMGQIESAIVKLGLEQVYTAATLMAEPKLAQAIIEAAQLQPSPRLEDIYSFEEIARFTQEQRAVEEARILRLEMAGVVVPSLQQLTAREKYAAELGFTPGTFQWEQITKKNWYLEYQTYLAATKTMPRTIERYRTGDLGPADPQFIRNLETQLQQARDYCAFVRSKGLV